MEKTKKSKFKFFILIFLIILIFLAPLILRLTGHDILFYDYIKSLSNSKCFIGIYLSLFIITSFVSLPFLTFLGAGIFPFTEALIYSFLGNVISIILMFYLVRWLGRDYVKKYENKHKSIKNLDMEFKEHPFRNIILLRLFYLIPPEVPNILGGLSGMKFKNYFLASVLGLIPLTFFSVLLIKSYMWKNFHLIGLCIVIGTIMLVLPIIYFVNLRKIFKKKKVRKD